MLDFDHPAVAAFSPARIEDLALSDRPDRRSALCGKVHAVVGTIHLENGVKTGAGKLGTDADKLQREAKKSACHRSAVEIIIAAFSLLFLEINGKKFLSGIDQFGSQNLEGSFTFPALAGPLFVQKLESISLLDILFKIDLPGEEISPLRNYNLIQAI